MSAPVRACPTGKRRFATEDDAARALRKIQDAPADPARLYVPIATIACGRCKGHHLTGTPPHKPGGRTTRRRGPRSKGRGR